MHQAELSIKYRMIIRTYARIHHGFKDVSLLSTQTISGILNSIFLSELETCCCYQSMTTPIAFQDLV